MKRTVSVIIPTYNRPDKTRAAVQSVLNQSYREFEIILVDDGSEVKTDLSSLHLSNVRHKLVHMPHQGVAAARNAGLMVSSGDIISFLDSDDTWREKKLEEHIDLYSAHPNLNVVQNLEQWHRNGKVVQTPEHLLPAEGSFFERSLAMCCLSCSSFSMRRRVFEEVGFFRKPLRIAEDYDYAIRIASKFDIFLITKILIDKFSGEHAQLSSSEEAVDRFRVWSLVSTLIDTDLSCKQRKSVCKTLEKKTAILLGGARRRGLNSDINAYEYVQSFLPECEGATFKNKFDFSKLNPILSDRPKCK